MPSAQLCCAGELPRSATCQLVVARTSVLVAHRRHRGAVSEAGHRFLQRRSGLRVPGAAVMPQGVKVCGGANGCCCLLPVVLEGVVGQRLVLVAGSVPQTLTWGNPFDVGCDGPRVDAEDGDHTLTSFALRRALDPAGPLGVGNRLGDGNPHGIDVTVVGQLDGDVVAGQGDDLAEAEATGSGQDGNLSVLLGQGLDNPVQLLIGRGSDLLARGCC